ncbi:hypothetical protein [Mucilaginibacter aquaedulcis]|uniref:hypothetical protein n=1 Tax=Mucilaginibacter aquaedulcis TaxID=1187081 RepID=UPI0025B5CD89|nr:hypothetical protein [Mucilaginibacter aquaedulcis]MDN3551014.1 hypothetical protein [Mucilaginibacter aquaedulcis]
MKPIVKTKEMAAYAERVRQMGKNPHLLATHVSMYAALFVCWQRSGYSNPFPVSRQLLMSYSRIASTATYHKCIKELETFGYICYYPSYHPVKGSLVEWPEDKHDNRSTDHLI